ncbi:MAG: P27 family phage terminase small subunit [Actinomycetota bacterium]|nr:P27 family phage terminase small subunit [Actinomycetota bacterium]
MGARGTIPMPANVRELHGNRHKPAAEGVQAVVAAPTPPADLDAEAKREWKRAVVELTRLRLLSLLDRALLVTYCEAWSVNRKMEQPKRAEWYRLNVLPLAKELGLTPNARLRMRAPEVETADAEGLD